MADDVLAAGPLITHVAIKVRFAPCSTSARVTKLAEPSTDAQVVAGTEVRLLDRYDRLRSVRLLGVRVDLAPLADEKARSGPGAGGPEWPPRWPAATPPR